MTQRVSVIVPTVGRATLLRACLASIAACDPPPAELVVVDQSGDPEIARLVAGLPGGRHVTCDGSGAGRARNAGARYAGHEWLLMTDDDCTVARDWVGATAALLAANPGAILTGRVLPAGAQRPVPSTIDDPEPRDHTGRLAHAVLYPPNMACPRADLLAAGGFDERLAVAEDNDLCYRWLRAGRPLRYEPSMVVWHHGWRGPADLERLWPAYWHGQGVFYGKHLRRGDLRMLPWVAYDLEAGLRAAAARTPRWSDPRRTVVPALLSGLAHGWRLER